MRVFAGGVLLRGAALLSGLAVLPLAGINPTPQQPTFAEISRAIHLRCTPCHQIGGMGPFSFSTYEEVRRHARDVGVAAINGAMPPIFARSDYGEFSISPKLTSEESVAIRRWAMQGAAEGTVRSKPPPPIHRSWSFGKPDLEIVVGSGKLVKDEGKPHSVAYTVTLNDAPDRRLVAFDVLPSNPACTRQIELARAGGEPIGAWAAAYFAWRLPAGFAVSIPGNSLLVRARYHPSGKAEDASFRLGLYFSNAGCTAADILSKSSGAFTLGPNGKREWTETIELSRDTRIAAIIPTLDSHASHASITLEPGANELLDMSWSELWNGAYNFVNAPLLTAGTKLKLRVLYQNGWPENPFQQTPKEVVVGKGRISIVTCSASPRAI